MNSVMGNKAISNKSGSVTFHLEGIIAALFQARQQLGCLLSRDIHIFPIIFLSQPVVDAILVERKRLANWACSDAAVCKNHPVARRARGPQRLPRHDDASQQLLGEGHRDFYRQVLDLRGNSDLRAGAWRQWQAAILYICLQIHMQM
jgi:hypothetical protein